MKTPELLLPAGNIETFIAAIEGGADAVYLGLKEFNARGRAKNFNIFQLRNLTYFAHKRGKKIYLTLNTVIKNNELSKLMDILYQVSQVNVDAVIIQDLGVLHIINKFFNNLNIHASTQTGINNSMGVNYFSKFNVKRVILARELTKWELEEISKRAKIPIEIFIHGALCYSLSGMCLFSSFLGGQSANRGLCRQPCRRLYATYDEKGYFFNLKDNMQIDNIPVFKKMNIASLKVEGRMKSAEYIYKVARAYRMALDNSDKISMAKEILKEDFAREKTQYFLGQNLKNAISKNPYTGLLIGRVAKIEKDGLIINSNIDLKSGFRIRFQDKSGRDSDAIKIKTFKKLSENTYKIFDTFQTQKDTKVFLLGKGDIKFDNKIPKITGKIKFQFPKKGKIYKSISLEYKSIGKTELYFRIDNPDWIRKLNFRAFDYLILNFAKNDLEHFDFSMNIIKKNISKIVFQFPKFISEENIKYYWNKARSLYLLGVRNFMLSHISQMKLLKGLKDITMFGSENIYVFNDAAAKFLYENGVKKYIYPFENEFTNIQSMKNKNGIVPLFFKPTLFNSRMPVVNIQKEFKDNKFEYEKFVRNGITITVPKIPVALFQFKRKLNQFNRFLIDLSFFKPSKGVLKKVLEKYKNEEAYQPSKTFNFKKGLG